MSTVKYAELLSAKYSSIITSGMKEITLQYVKSAATVESTYAVLAGLSGVSFTEICIGFAANAMKTRKTIAILMIAMTKNQKTAILMYLKTIQAKKIKSKQTKIFRTEQE